MSLASLVKTIVVGATLILALGAAGESAKSPATQNADEAPIISIWHQSGMRLDSESKSGLVAAVWRDGMMLFAADACAPGQRMFVAKVPPDEVQAALRAIRESGFFGLEHDIRVPDADYTTIYVDDGKSAMTRSWHENYLPGGFGGEIGRDDSYRRFARTWRRTRAEIAALTPIEIEVMDGKPPRERAFRGYDVENPHKTPWRP